MITVPITVCDPAFTGFAPPMVRMPATLLYTIAPTAPFSCAQAILLSNGQRPRSISGILPAGLARYGSPPGSPGVPGGHPRPTWTTSPVIVEPGRVATLTVNAPSVAARDPAKVLLVNEVIRVGLKSSSEPRKNWLP